MKDLEIKRIHKLIYWMGFLYTRYLGKKEPKSSYYDPCVGTKLMEYSEAQTVKKIKKEGREFEKPREILTITPSEGLPRIKELLKKQFPFVLKGGAKDWPAVGTWTPEFFKKQFGHLKVPVNASKPHDPVLVTEKEKLDKTNFSDIMEMTEATVSELADNVMAAGNLIGANLEDILHYNNRELVNKYLRPLELGEWTGVKKELTSPFKKGGIHSYQLFMQSKAAHTHWHCANTDNFFVQIYGKKKWSFIHPKYSLAMETLIKKKTVYQTTMIDSREPLDIIKKRGYKLYPYIPVYEVVLEPGDILNNPRFWWHAVTTGGESPTIATAIRTLVNPLQRPSPVFELMQLFDFDMWKMMISALKHKRVTDEILVKDLYKDFKKKPST